MSTDSSPLDRCLMMWTVMTFSRLSKSDMECLSCSLPIFRMGVMEKRLTGVGLMRWMRT